MHMETGTTRRSFLVGTGVALGTAVGAVALGGCSSKDASSGDQDLASTGVDFDEEYDVVVVGSGLAGLATAVTVGTEGDGATCLLLEKSDSPLGGGNSAFSGGMIMTTDNYDDCLEYVKALRGENETVSDAICEAYVREAMEHANWLRSLGAPDDFYVSYEDPDGFCQGVYKYDAECTELDPNASVHGIRFNPDNPDGLTHVIKFLSAKADELADVITRKTKAPAVRLIQDPVSCAIEGVTYLDGNKEVNVRANKGVVMCCGGFENNPEMMANYFKAYGCHPAAAVHNTGDGIVMCEKVGASMWHMHGIAGFWPHVVSLDGTGFTSNLEMIDSGYGILVGTNGRRFTPECPAVSYGNNTRVALDLKLTNGNRHGDYQSGGEWMTRHLPAVSWGIFDAAGFEKATTYFPFDDPVAEGFAYSADTIEGLAAQIDVPVEELTRTVATWNAMLQNGGDTQFYRADDGVAPIVEPPFYAARQCPWFLNTDGGPERNEFGQILDHDKNPIPNLYSAGEFGSIWSDMYNGGGNCGECLAFGRISARNCLGIA